VIIATRRGSNGKALKYLAMPAASASCGKSKTHCAGCKPITSMSIRFTGPIPWL
jgi:hypothetical protein